MQPTDERLGIVRLPLPDGRAIPLQLTYAALDAKGHDWLLDQFKAMQKGKPGASLAMAEVLEIMSAGKLKAADVMAAPMAEYPMAECLRSCWRAWELAQHGPSGRPAADGSENPRLSPRKTWWGRIFGRLSGPG
ncbi:hypothetical protein [Brevundimonas olei]|uniref:hypothetical protein n=1 Tax=Brevundimonas olei TaxID=657642 RepID=UPI0031CE202B